MSNTIRFQDTFEKARKARIIMEMQVNSMFDQYDVSIIGSYATGNVGDLAIGKSIKSNLTRVGIKSNLFSRKVLLFDDSVRILGGGGLIHENRKNKVQRDLELLNNDSMIIGIGVGPINDEELRENIRDTISDLSVVTVRDQKSKEILEEIVDTTIHSLACPAFLLNIPESTKTYYTGISLRPLPQKYIHYETNNKNNNVSDIYGQIGFSHIQDKYIDNICMMRRKLDNLKHIPFHHMDTKFINNIDNVDAFKYTYDVDNTLQRVTSADRMICMRYHSLVFSILADKPSIAIAYAPKVAALAERAGIPWFRPHEKIQLNFEKPTNRRSIIDDAQKNIELIKDNLNK